jgi:hypothetical protein
MTRRKQSVADRRQRLSEGRCPVHGLYMPQIGPWVGEECLCGCPRDDCKIEVWMPAPDGPATLLPEWEHLLTEWN